MIYDCNFMGCSTPITNGSTCQYHRGVLHGMVDIGESLYHLSLQHQNTGARKVKTVSGRNMETAVKVAAARYPQLAYYSIFPVMALFGDPIYDGDDYEKTVLPERELEEMKKFEK